MIVKPKVIFNWSGGKDSSLCLYKILQSNQYEVTGLLTTVSLPYQRISMHGVRVELLHEQAERIGLPLVKAEVPEMPSMEDYERVMSGTLQQFIAQGVTASVFGDIFLEDLRDYREKKLAEINLTAIFPLWKIPTDQLVREFIDLGFKAVITCVSDAYLDKSFVGRIIDEQFLKDLPAHVDPCGEHGEFHSFVYDGPLFSTPVKFEKGEIVHRRYDVADSGNAPPIDNGFWYCDLIPVSDQ